MLKRMTLLTLTLNLILPAVSLHAEQSDFVGVADARTVEFFEIWAVQGQQITLRLQGAGYTDLDLCAFDVREELIACDTRLSDRGFVRWRAPYSGPYFFSIDNLGFVPNPYTLRLVTR